MSYTNTGLVAHAKAALADKTKYMWGGIYRPITKAYVEQLAKMYPTQYTTARKNTLNALPDGYYGIDCVGLIKSYYWGGKGSKGYSGSTDVNAHGMYNNAKTKGKIDALPEQAGLILYCKSRPHVGVYIGNGEVIESTISSRGDGVVKSKLSDFGWEYWCQCPYIVADNAAEKLYKITATKTVKKAEVEKYKVALKSMGFEVGVS